MKECAELKKLLHEKKELFLDFKAVTEKLKYYTIEELDMMESCMNKRDEIITEIDKLDDSMSRICSEAENGQLIKDAIKNKCDYGVLDGELLELYLIGQQIFQVITEIQQWETDVLGNMSNLIRQLEVNIKKNNEKSKISGYYQHMSYGVNKGALYNKKS